MKTIVAKFGGSSLANAEQMKRVVAIVRADPGRKIVVVSAPGKRANMPNDVKVTDLFYQWQRKSLLGLDCNKEYRLIYDRFVEIVKAIPLASSINLADEFQCISKLISDGAYADYAASRGEYLNAKILAAALGYEFVDAADCISFDKEGNHQTDYENLRSLLKGRRVVIPGFYGSMPNGQIKTFSRGGSDITGAIVARAVRASLYENWTDVSGLLMAHPEIVDKPQQINCVTYRELRELAYMGANVFHEEAMFPVEHAKIPIRIRNTNIPNDEGTLIVAKRQRSGMIVGIAGRRDFTVITVEKRFMNKEVGFVRKLLSVLETHGVSFEHMPSGIDSVSVIIDSCQLVNITAQIVSEIKHVCSPDSVITVPNIALIATVGEAMAHTPGIAAKLFKAVAAERISVRMINQGSGETSILIGVDNEDYKNAVRAIYAAFVS